MTADHGDNAVPNRFGQSADGESGRFDIVSRGYDRRQVEEHIAKLERTVGQQRSSHGPEKIGEFTGRLRSILEAAEEEAKDIRTQAREYARGEEEAARARLSELERRRDNVVTELGRVRGQLDEIMSRLGGTQSPPPGTPPQGTPVSRSDGKSVPARVEKSGPTQRADQERRPEPASAQPNGTPRATPATPGGGTPLPPAEAGRPGPRPASGDGQRSGPPQRPAQQPPSVPQNMPSSPAAAPSPKPRPTPSPRPRPGGPPTSGASGNGGSSSAFGAGAR